MSGCTYVMFKYLCGITDFYKTIGTSGRFGDGIIETIDKCS